MCVYTNPFHLSNQAEDKHVQDRCASHLSHAALDIMQGHNPDECRRHKDILKWSANKLCIMKGIQILVKIFKLESDAGRTLVRKRASLFQPTGMIKRKRKKSGDFCIYELGTVS